MDALACRAFAVVPAAGIGRRMGQPKLLLPWGNSTLIEQTLAAWKQCAVAAVVVVVRSDDVELAEVCRQAGAEVVVPPIAPPEMRDSVEHALSHLHTEHSPAERDVWLLAPADMPNLSPDVVGRLLGHHRSDQPAILVPTIAGRRGHPVLFPWPLAREVRRLPAGDGIDVLTRRSGVCEVACDSYAGHRSTFEDVDTPEDYRRLREGAGE